MSDHGSRDSWLGPVGVTVDVGEEQGPKAVAKLVIGECGLPPDPEKSLGT